MVDYRTETSEQARIAAVVILLSAVGLEVAGGFRHWQTWATLPIAATGIETQVDPNSATWTEFAQLPGIGEALGRRIIQTREILSETGGGQPFKDSTDLRRVRGIGPRILLKIRPFLRFPSGRTPR